LREVLDSDLPTIFEDQRDPEAVRMAAFPPRDEGAFYEHWARIRTERDTLIRTIEFDGQVAGYVSSFERNGERLVGYWISKSFWGKGVATCALAAFLKHDMLRPLFARVVPHNVGSIRVVEKCGFVEVGRGRGAAPTGGEEEEEIVYRMG
jgi:RimJ/RimL family protein N-acetyltransferase